MADEESIRKNQESYKIRKPKEKKEFLYWIVFHAKMDDCLFHSFLTSAKS